MIGQDFLCLRGVEGVELHEVGDQCLTWGQILLGRVEVHAGGELHRTHALTACGQDARTLAVGIGHDGVAVGKQCSLDQADGFLFLDRLRRHQADGRTLENVGVLDQRLVGQALVDAEHVHDWIVRELKRDLITLDDKCFRHVAGKNRTARTGSPKSATECASARAEPAARATPTKSATERATTRSGTTSPTKSWTPAAAGAAWTSAAGSWPCAASGSPCACATAGRRRGGS